MTRHALPNRLARLAAAGLLAVLAATAARGQDVADTTATPTHCTVLLYHKFDEPEHPSTNISSTVFRAQLRYLADNDYTVLSMEAFTGHIERGEPFPEKCVLITIDDPYPSIDRVARPMLAAHGYPWTLFVWTKGVEDGYTDLMTWDDIERLAATPDVTVANHTHSHPYLGVPGVRESRTAYLGRVAGEIQDAQRLLREHGVENPYLAFPYGHYNNIVIDAARAAGYRYMFTQDPGAVDVRTPPERIPRAAIVGGDDEEMTDFVYRLSLSPLHVTDVHPPHGLLQSNPPVHFGVRLLDPTRYHGGQVNMFVSELGRVDAAYDAATGALRFVSTAPLGRKMNRLIVTARDRRTGTFSMYAQMLIRPFDELTTASR